MASPRTPEGRAGPDRLWSSHRLFFPVNSAKSFLAWQPLVSTIALQVTSRLQKAGVYKLIKPTIFVVCVFSLKEIKSAYVDDVKDLEMPRLLKFKARW